MYTAQDIFNITADLIDERLANGTINATTTAVYKARTPGILNLWQSENVNNGNMFKTYEITCTRTEPMAWNKYTMPDDFKNIDQIIKLTTDGRYIKKTEYKWEGKKDLYINSLFEGTIRIVYKSIPTLLTSINDTLQIDEVTSIGAAYFLAAHLLLTEDPASASYFNERYSEYRANTNIKNPSPIEDIVNVQLW